MASVQVFVDDLVLGTLPMVCAKTGVRAEGRSPVQARAGAGTSPWASSWSSSAPSGG